MICLLVGGERELWKAVRLRLRGAEFFEPLDLDWQNPDGIQNFLALNGIEACLLVDDSPPIGSQLRQLVDLGKHVLVLGHLGLKVRMQTLARDASANGTAFSVVNPDHYLPSRQLIRQQLEAGKFGEPGLVRIHRWEHFQELQSPPESDLPTAMICDIEMATWLIGRPPEVVHATAAPTLDTLTKLERTIQVHLGFSGGAMALIDYSNRLPAGDSYQSLSLIGSSGATYADDHHNVQLLYQGSRPKAVKVDEDLRRWVNLTQDFIDGIQSGRDFTDGVRAWQTALDVAEAAHQSLTSRRAVRVEGKTP